MSCAESSIPACVRCGDSLGWEWWEAPTPDKRLYGYDGPLCLACARTLLIQEGTRKAHEATDKLFAVEEATPWFRDAYPTDKRTEPFSKPPDSSFDPAAINKTKE